MKRWYVLAFSPLNPLKSRQFCNAVTNEDIWRKFDNYAFRVREFTHRCRDDFNHFDDGPVIHPSLYVLLAKTKKYIFPNLHNLHAASTKCNTPLELMLCITPSLHIFRLAPSNEKYRFADTSYTVDTTLDMLTTGNGGAPNAHLQRLELRTIISGHDLDKIGSLTNLRSLRVTGIEPETQDGFEGSPYLKRLSRLPYLQELLLSLEENETFLSVENDGFPSLK
jgi:hypothetical protein